MNILSVSSPGTDLQRDELGGTAATIWHAANQLVVKETHIVSHTF